MKRAMLIGMVTVLLTACGSSNDQAAVECAQEFWNGTIGTCLPDGWKVLSKETLATLGVPEETVAAFQVQDPTAGQFDTVTVTEEPLTEEMTTTEYSDANIIAVSALPDYRLIDKTAAFVDGQESSLHVFSARPSVDAPVRRYYQLSAANGRTGYSLTGSFPLSIEDRSAAEVEFILRGATFTDPKDREASGNK